MKTLNLKTLLWTLALTLLGAVLCCAHSDALEPPRFSTGFTHFLPHSPTYPNWEKIIPTGPQVQIPERPLTPEEQEFKKEWEEVQRQASKKESQGKPMEAMESLIPTLLNEFGPRAKYGFTKHFVFIYDTSDDYALWTSYLCENVEDAYERFVKYLGIGMSELTEPMVVIIFARKADFDDYMTAHMSDFKNRKNKPIGCYFSGPNRSVQFDSTGLEEQLGAVEQSKERLSKKKRQERFREAVAEILARPESENFVSVLIHETTHQVSYNRGMFCRTGRNPTWAIEGLAMLFEPPCGEPKDGGWKVENDFPINRQRVREFQAFARTNKDPSVVRRVATAEEINGDEAGAYPVSWALFAYLLTYYPKQLSQYLQDNMAVGQRSSYTSSERERDFTYYFTDKWDRLYTELCAFVDALAMQLDGVDPETAQTQARAKYGLPDPREEAKQKQKRVGKKPRAQKDDPKSTSTLMVETEDNAEPASVEPTQKPEEAIDKPRRRLFDEIDWGDDEEEQGAATPKQESQDAPPEQAERPKEQNAKDENVDTPKPEGDAKSEGDAKPDAPPKPEPVAPKDSVDDKPNDAPKIPPKRRIF
ncbi:MAG: DUF1570 domain-containing protein [Planctomycetia bacterium]|nr:DUF1570 domain-containing protein [Planctomycetia bacterium]